MARMADAIANPFAALSFIAAPAVLTNAASLLTMSTSNRLARAVDRARELARQLESTGAKGASAAGDDRRLRELTAVEDRGVLLLRALRSYYSAIGGFASATLISLIGAVVSARVEGLVVQASESLAIAAGAFAVGALVHGSALLMRETSLAVGIMRERTALVRSQRHVP
jgi:hypothetical protein